MERIPNRLEDVDGTWFTVIEDPIIARASGRVWRQAMDYGSYYESAGEVWCRVWLKALRFDAQAYTRPQLNAAINSHFQKS